ncbi:MAG: hypothetical protein AVDCRST_MAG41-4100, partial [uncultured Corynebacteriales bacterium]
AVLLAGCVGQAGPTGPPAGSAPAATTAAAPAAATGPDLVTAAYLRYWDAVRAAHRAGDPAAGGLAAVAADPELGRVRATVARNRAQQLSVRGEVRHEPAPPVVSGGTATIEDCYDITGWNPVDLRTGDPVGTVEAGGTGRYRVRWALRGSGESWKVVDQEALGGC